MSACAWTHDAQTLEDACEMFQPEGYINFEQFEAEVRSAQNNIHSNHRDVDLPAPDDPISRLKMGALINALPDSNANIPMGQIPTASQLLTDHTADQEREITRMLRHAGVQAERQNYRVSLSTTKKSTFTGDEPLPVVGLSNVYVDDSFFIMDTTARSVGTAGPVEALQTVPKNIEVKSKQKRVALEKGQKYETNKNKDAVPKKPSSSKFLSPKEVYIRKNSNKQSSSS